MADDIYITGFFENKGKYGKFLSTTCDRDAIIESLRGLPAGRIYLNMYENEKREDAGRRPAWRLIAKGVPKRGDGGQSVDECPF